MLGQYAKNVISENVPFEITRGKIPGFTPIIKSGENDNIAATIQTIWPETGDYVYPATATKMFLSGANVNDTSAGTGIQQIFIAGLDADWNWIYETLETNGQTGVETVKEYIRINCFTATRCGSLGTNAGNVYIGTGTITTGKPAVVYGVIPNGAHLFDNRCMQTPFSVPKGYKAHIMGATGGVGAGKSFKIGLYGRTFGGCFIVVGKLPLYENSLQIVFNYAPSFPEKSDIELKGKEDGATGVSVESSMTIVLERVDLTVPFILPGSLLTSDVWES